MATIQCTNDQLRLIQDALELFSRIGIMQIDRIKDHPSIESLLREQCRPKKALEVGDETERGKVVEIGEGYIKTEGQWSDWKDRADVETIKNNPNGWVIETRTWEDVDAVKLSIDYEKYHKLRDDLDDLCNSIKNLVANDSMISSKNASYGIGRRKEGEHNIDAYDMIQVIRHEFWKENPNRNNMTVNSSVTQFGSKSLIKVKLD